MIVKESEDRGHAEIMPQCSLITLSIRHYNEEKDRYCNEG